MGAISTRLEDVCRSGSKEHPLFAPLTPNDRMDAETFGKLIVYAWAAKNGRSDLPDRDTLIQELLDNRDSLPSIGKEVMHFEPRIIGAPTIAEYSEYMAAAQDVGLIKRYNPTYIRCSVEVGQLEARDRLDEYRKLHKGLVSWLEDRVNRLSTR